MKTFNEFSDHDNIIEATQSDRSLRSKYMKVIRQFNLENKPSELHRLQAKANLIMSLMTLNGRYKLLFQLK
jgi:hypothetical protein